MYVLFYTIGLLGLLLLITFLTHFVPLTIVQASAQEYSAFLFILSILILASSITMIYFGFFRNHKSHKSLEMLFPPLKLAVFFSIAVLIGNYISSRLNISNSLLLIIINATIVIVVLQILRSHMENFKWKWFVFYYLVVLVSIWIINQAITTQVSFVNNFFLAIFVGSFVGIVVSFVQLIKIHRHSVEWISAILLVLLVVGNLESFAFDDHISFTGFDNNTSSLSEARRSCPGLVSDNPIYLLERRLQLMQLGDLVKNQVNKSVWTIENDIRTCYKGRYTGQFPDWYYCDDMIVSRWETSSRGTISYRWYTAVTAEWMPDNSGHLVPQYILSGFSCDNGRRLVVEKEITNYYVHVSRDGTEIRVEY